MSDYAIQFRTLASTTDCNSEAQFDAFLFDLSDTIKDELTTRELPSDFQALVDLAIHIDNRIKQRNQERYSRVLEHCPGSLTCQPALESSLPDPQASTASVPEPMQVDRTRLNPSERQRRLTTNSCLYCGQTGHFVSSCPLKASAHL